MAASLAVPIYTITEMKKKLDSNNIIKVILNREIVIATYRIMKAAITLIDNKLSPLIG
jgi:hypothetical protein